MLCDCSYLKSPNYCANVPYIQGSRYTFFKGVKAKSTQIIFSLVRENWSRCRRLLFGATLESAWPGSWSLRCERIFAFNSVWIFNFYFPTQAGLFYVTSVASTSLVSGLAYTLLRFEKRKEQKKFRKNNVFHLQSVSLPHLGLHRLAGCQVTKISFAFDKVKLLNDKIFIPRVPPKSDEDSETFTPVHPDVMSAPEMEAVFKNCKSRLYEVTDATFAGIF